MVIPRAELLQHVPSYEIHPAQGGKLYIFNQTLRPLSSPDALIERLRRQRPEELPWTPVGSSGQRVNRELIRHVHIGDDDLVFKRVRFTLPELKTGRSRFVVRENNETDVRKRRAMNRQHAAIMKDVVHMSSPVRQMIVYFDAVARLGQECKKRKWDINKVWPLEVPMAYYQANSGEGWFVFNFIPPAVPPKQGTEEVISLFKAAKDEFPTRMLQLAGVRIKDEASYVMTGDPEHGYRKIFVDTELLLPGF